MNFRYLSVSQAPSNELLKLLNSNMIGTPGHGMLYQHVHVNEKLVRIKEPYFVNLERTGKIAGTCCFCKRTIFNAERELTSFYVRYFSFQDIFRRKSLTVKSNRLGALREEVARLLKGQGLQ